MKIKLCHLFLTDKLFPLAVEEDGVEWLNWRWLAQPREGSHPAALSFRRDFVNTPGPGLGASAAAISYYSLLRGEAEAEEENGLLKAKHKQISKLLPPCRTLWGTLLRKTWD